MYWKNNENFWKCLLHEYTGTPKNIFLRMFFPPSFFVLSWHLGCNQIKCNGDYFRVIHEYPIVFIPTIFFFLLLYVCKPLNDFFSIRQEFVFGEKEIVVKKYFKNYFNSNKDLKFSREEIQSITDMGSAGIAIYLNLFNQVLIPFLNQKDHAFLMGQFNPDDKIKIIKKS